MCHFLSFMTTQHYRQYFIWQTQSTWGHLPKEGAEVKKTPMSKWSPSPPFLALEGVSVCPDMGRRHVWCSQVELRAQNLKLQTDPNLPGPGASFKLSQYDNPNGFHIDLLAEITERLHLGSKIQNPAARLQAASKEGSVWENTNRTKSISIAHAPSNKPGYQLC